MIAQRTAGLPIEHIVGWAEFCGLRVSVGPGVFVPRRRTEFLVSEAAARCPPRAVVVDLCCGTGALGAAVAAAADVAELHAADVDPAAVAYAARTIGPGGGHVYQGDLYAPLPAALRGRVDLLLANVPYVPTREIGLLPPEASRHEPAVALDGGTDGLGVFRRAAAGAAGWLAPGGHVLSETSGRQAADATAILTRCGLKARVASDPERNATVVIGTRPLPAAGAG